MWYMPSSRKENAAEAVPAGCVPTLRFQSQGNGISKVGMKAETKQSQHLDCRRPLEQLLCERGEKGMEEKSVCPSKKCLEEKKSSEPSCWWKCSSLNTRRFWGAVSFSQIAQQELPKSFVFTSSKM